MTLSEIATSPTELTADQLLHARCGSCGCVLNWRHHCPMPKRFYATCCDLIYYAYQPEGRAIVYTVFFKQVELKNVVRISQVDCDMNH